MSLLEELTVPLCFSLMLALAAFALIAASCVLISRASKRLRERDGQGVLRESRRMGWALAAFCLCWTAGQLLFDCAVREDASIGWSLLGSVRDLFLLAAAGAWVCRMFHRKGVELIEENQPDLGE